MTRMSEFLKQNNRVSGPFESSREISGDCTAIAGNPERGAIRPASRGGNRLARAVVGPPQSVTLLPSQSAFAVLDTML